MLAGLSGCVNTPRPQVLLLKYGLKNRKALDALGRDEMQGAFRGGERPQRQGKQDRKAVLRAQVDPVEDTRRTHTSAVTEEDVAWSTEHISRRKKKI